MALAVVPGGAAAVATLKAEHRQGADGSTADLSEGELLALAAALAANPGDPGLRLRHVWWGPDMILEQLFNVVWKLCPEFEDEEAALAFSLRFMASVTALPGGLAGVRALLAEELRDKAEMDGDDDDAETATTEVV